MVFIHHPLVDMTTINQAPVAGCGPVFVWMYILGLLSLVPVFRRVTQLQVGRENSSIWASRCIQHLPRPHPRPGRHCATLVGGEVAWRGLTGSLLPQQDPSVSTPEAALVPEGAAGPLPTAAWSGDGHHCHRGVRGEGPALTEEVLQAVRGWGCLPAELGIRWAGFIPAPVPPGPLSEPGPLPPRAGPGCLGTVVTPCTTRPVPRLASGRPWRPCAARNGSRCCPGAAGDQGVGARAASEAPSLFPYLCLLSEKELVGLLLQVCTPGRGQGHCYRLGGCGRSAAAGVGGRSGGPDGAWGLWCCHSRAAPQTLQALPPHGESLLFLARAGHACVEGSGSGTRWKSWSSATPSTCTCWPRTPR